MSIATMIGNWTQTAQFYRNTTTVTATGRRSTTAVAYGSTVACALQPAGNEVRDLYGARDIVVDAVLYLAADQNVQEGDSVVVGTESFAVVGERDQAGLGRLWAVDVRRTMNTAIP